MHLNIKDPEAHRLARAISQATGESMTHVVTDALRSRYHEIERLRRRASLEELRTIARRSAGLVQMSYKPHGDILYDEDGLPA